jgi:hypothetical protein
MFTKKQEGRELAEENQIKTDIARIQSVSGHINVLVGATVSQSNRPML